MDDDDDSQMSPATASPASSSPPSTGRITVTVASPGLPTPENALTLALAVPKPRSAGGGNGREDCWSEGATAVLIDAWGERYLELSRGNLKQQHWKEVSEIVNSREGHGKAPKTDVQCKNRIDTVKKKYKAEKAKAAAGGPSRWAFYKRLDQLIGPRSTKMAAAAVGGAPPQPRKISALVPFGVRSAQYHQRPQNPQPPPKPKLQPFGARRRRPADSDSSRSDPKDSPDSTDCFGAVGRRKGPKLLRETPKFEPAARRGGDGGELTRAILKFGQVFEQAESSKMQMVMDMEKKRMKFAKEMELQRMQFFMKMQVELLQLKHGRRGETTTTTTNNNNNNHHHHRQQQHHRPHRNNNPNHNHSDSSN